jgi:hypothetical protein
MPNLKAPTQILLSLTTAPLLLGLLGAKALVELMKTIGQASEEVFRGDRLPVLNQPTPPDVQLPDPPVQDRL